METKTINLRDVPEDLVRKAKAYAALRGMSLKDFILRAVQKELDVTGIHTPAMSFFVSEGRPKNVKRKAKKSR